MDIVQDTMDKVQKQLKLGPTKDEYSFIYYILRSEFRRKYKDDPEINVDESKPQRLKDSSTTRVGGVMKDKNQDDLEVNVNNIVPPPPEDNSSTRGGGVMKNMMCTLSL
jgi:hypothetical protein